MQIFLRRLLGVLVLDPRTFEEVEADPGATFQAMGVVLLSAFASGMTARGLGAPSTIVPGLVVYALCSWVAWAILSYQIGTQLLPTKRTRTDLGELLRTLGFAAAPGGLLAFGIIPPLAVPLLVASVVWMLCAMVIAVRQALDFTSTLRAVAVCVIGLALSTLIAMLLGSTVLSGA